jgi:hypothetical protein
LEGQRVNYVLGYYFFILHAFDAVLFLRRATRAVKLKNTWARKVYFTRTHTIVTLDPGRGEENTT